jgi:Amt family ammonium transporter
MNPSPAQLSDLASALCFGLILLVPLALAGIAILNAGLGRVRSAAHAMLGSLVILAAAAATFAILGYSFTGYPGLPQHSITLSHSTWGWLAALPIGLRRWELNTSPAALAALLQLFTVGLAALIPWGAGADRWRLRAAIASTIVFSAITYPLIAHWAWGGGWLAHLGCRFGLGLGFLDTAGAGVVQATGGLTALAIVWLAGARHGKYHLNQLPSVFPGHNMLYVTYGGLLALAGWLGLNGAGAILFAGASPAALPFVAVNTVLSASGALLAALVVTNVRFGKPDASLCANGWMAGLVTSSALCAWVSPAGALLAGALIGCAIPFLAEILELHCGVDDPAGAVAVHAGGGLWGLLALGLLAHTGAPRGGQLLAQLIGIATLLGFVLPLTYALNWLVGRFTPHRVSPEGERAGMDMHELGAGAYPEFVIHADDFFLR